MYRIIIDTSTLIAGLRSRKGASYRLLMLLGANRFEVTVSVALILEYEAVAKRLVGSFDWTTADIEAIIDYICSVAEHVQVHYLWRPQLRDADDDTVLEVPIAARCDFIVTHNKTDFQGAERFGVRVVDAAEFLKILGGIS
jgi:putative PIN family toxin of toxin-antitoxin system